MFTRETQRRRIGEHRREAVRSPDYDHSDSDYDSEPLPPDSGDASDSGSTSDFAGDSGEDSDDVSGSDSDSVCDTDASASDSAPNSDDVSATTPSLSLGLVYFKGEDGGGMFFKPGALGKFDPQLWMPKGEEMRGADQMDYSSVAIPGEANKPMASTAEEAEA